VDSHVNFKLTIIQIESIDIEDAQPISSRWWKVVVPKCRFSVLGVIL